MKKHTLSSTIAQLALVTILIQGALFAYVYHQSKHIRSGEPEPKNQAPLVRCGDYKGRPEAIEFLFPRRDHYPKACTVGECRVSSFRDDARAHLETKKYHVISAREPLSRGKELKIGEVSVRIAKGELFDELVLLNEKPMIWTFAASEVVQVKKITLISKTNAWVKNVPRGVKVERVSSESICHHAQAWEDEHNPEENFRKMILSLRQKYETAELSFQGAKKAVQFTLPLPAYAEDLATWRQARIERRQRLEKFSSTKTVIVFRSEGLNLEYSGLREPAQTAKELKSALSFRDLGLFGELYQFADRIEWHKSTLRHRLEGLVKPKAYAWNQNDHTLLVFDAAKQGRLIEYRFEKSLQFVKSLEVPFNEEVLHLEWFGDRWRSLVRTEKASKWMEWNNKIELLTEKNLSQRFPYDATDWRLEGLSTEKHIVFRVMSPVFPQGRWAEIYPDTQRLEVYY